MKRLKAGYTVEASVIAALLLFLTVFVLYLFFLCFDQLQIDYLLRRTLVSAREEIQSGQNFSAEDLAKHAVENQKRLIVSEGVTYQGEEKGGFLYLTCEGSSQGWRAAGTFTGFGRRKVMWSMTARIRVNKHEQSLRLLKYLKEGADQWISDIKGN